MLSRLKRRTSVGLALGAFALATLGVAAVGGPAQAAPGDLLATVDLPGNTATSVGGTAIPTGVVPGGLVYVANQANNTDLLIFEPPPGDGAATLVSTKNLVDGFGAAVNVSCVAWDPTRNVLWGAHSGDDSVYQIDVGDLTADGDALTTFQFNPGQVQVNFCDGIAYDAENDTIWYSPDVNLSVFEYGTGAPSANALGVLLSTVSPEDDTGVADGSVSGVVVGSGNSLYVARNGDAEIRRVDKTTGAFISDFATTSGRVEDLTCDPLTYAPLEAVLAKDAFNPLYEAFEVELGTCPLPGEDGGIGEIKEGAFTPDPNGNGRAIAFDGLTTLYYTFAGDQNIYMATTAGASLGPIPDPGRGFTCGALSFDGTDLWCGTYDGAPSNIHTIDPTTGTATFEFTHVFSGNGCFGIADGFIDGLAYDRSDDTLWLSNDIDTEIWHLSLAGVPLGGSPFPTPMRPGNAGLGCNSGIAVAPGGFLELVLLALEDDGDGVSHFIVKVPKDDISGDPIVSFSTQDPTCCEDLDFDSLTFAPRAVVWSNAFTTNEIKAYDVQVTRTIGYWKNHPAEDFTGDSFLPIDLGDDDTNGVCMTAADQDDVDDILKAHRGSDAGPKLKAQLLAAELNLAIGDIPPDDLAAILPVIEDAHELLGRNGCDPDTGKKGVDRAEALALHALLDEFNNKYAP